MKHALLAATILSATACSNEHAHGDEGEVITTVTLSFMPAPPAAQVAIVGGFDDADGDGGAAPVVTGVGLMQGQTYAMTVTLTNKLSEPDADITSEVAAEGAEHQLFYTGDGAAAPLTVTYTDQDSGGLPIGLAANVVPTTPGTLVVTLKHLPPNGNAAQKVAGLADVARDQGLAALPGETDVSVKIPVAVAVP